jgi:hypothetical protein
MPTTRYRFMVFESGRVRSQESVDRESPREQSDPDDGRGD